MIFHVPKNAYIWILSGQRKTNCRACR